MILTGSLPRRLAGLGLCAVFSNAVFLKPSVFKPDSGEEEAQCPKLQNADSCKEIKDNKKCHTECCMGHLNKLSPSQKEYRVELKNFQNVQYYGDITIGGLGDSNNTSGASSKAQVFPAIYDTGSFEVMVLSELCEQCKSDLYDADTPLYEKSTTFSLFPTDKDEKSATSKMEKCKAKAEKTGKKCVYETVTASHVFGSGPVESVLGYETVKFGGLDVTQAPSLERMPFWQITKHGIKAWEAGAKFSAIIGLGPRDHVPQMENEEKDGAIDTLLERADVNKFSICLQRNPGGSVLKVEETEAHSQWPSGWLIFNAHTPQTESQVQVVGKVHWAVQMPRFAVSLPNPDGSGTMRLLDFCGPEVSENGCAAIVDSGTSLIAAPSVVIQKLIENLGLNEDCSNMDQMPDLQLAFGQGKFREELTLPPSAYLIRVEQVEQHQSVWQWWTGDKGTFSKKTSCVPAFMPMDKDSGKHGPVFIMGMSFLRYYKTTYVRATADGCEPKMYFDRVDAGCKAIKKGTGLIDQKKSRMEKVLDVNMEHVVLPDWAKGEEKEIAL